MHDAEQERLRKARKEEALQFQREQASQDDIATQTKDRQRIVSAIIDVQQAFEGDEAILSAIPSPSELELWANAVLEYEA